MKITTILEASRDKRLTTYSTHGSFDANGTQWSYTVRKSSSPADGLHVASYALGGPTNVDAQVWSEETAAFIHNDLNSPKRSELVSVHITINNPRLCTALFEQFRARLNSDWYIRVVGDSIELQCVTNAKRAPSSRLKFVRGIGVEV